MLKALAQEFDGASFWGLIDADRICCLDAAIADPQADPGLRAGGMPRFERLPRARRAERTDERLRARGRRIAADAGRAGEEPARP